MKIFCVGTLAVCAMYFAEPLRAAPSEVAPPDSWQLWSDQPASRWDFCYPVGNGTLGAMNLGSYPKDVVYLNHDCMWSHPQQHGVGPDSRKAAFDEAVDLFLKGDHAAGQGAYARGKKGSSGKGVYQCLGELTVTHGQPGAPTSSRRQLNLLTGESTTTIRTPEGVNTQTLIASYPDQCLVLRLETTATGGLDCRLNLNRVAGITRRFAEGDTFGYEGNTGATGARYVVRARVLPFEGGEALADENDMIIKGGQAATLVISVATDHNRADPRSPRRDDWAAEAQQRLAQASARGWKELQARAQADHEELMSRCVLDMGRTTPEVRALPMPKRMERVRQGEYDPDLLETFFQLGRHMLVGSSRPGSLPPNLQGLWGVGLKAAWSGDFHLNVNVQMNMWPANATGLSECNEPFFALLKLLHQYGQATAASIGCRGYAAGLASDGWGFADFVGGSLEWDSTLLGGHWAQEHLMEYYRFTQDKDFLREAAWPILRDGSLFMLDWMRENPANGMLIAGPGGSPENIYTYPDAASGKTRKAYINIGNTFSHAVAWETFSDTLACAKLLGVEDDLTAKVARALKRVPAPPIGPDGRIMEWREAFGEPWKGHRHKSHLYGLYPGRQISLEETPELSKAAEQSLRVRMDPKNGDTGGGGRTGWNLAWSANLWARLHRGEEALDMIQEQLRRQVNENLFNRCNRPYQIDGNLGAAAGIAEMLIQSHELTPEGLPLIRLLPALPARWSEGSAQGLRARGGFIVDMTWSKGKLDQATLHAPTGGKAVVVARGQHKPISLKPGASEKIK